ncbi:MAG: hypothetical protein ICV66_09330, partial [Chitinophagaceae bacterium]|nr:hypothetical protein [Chitinophagaceae bacterium]
LNLIRINKTNEDNYIDQNIAELLKMAKRDKYESYRDVIYYMAAQMEMSRNNFPAAQEYLLKSAKFQNENVGSSNSAFLRIADISFEQKKYLQAARFYDSVRIENLPTAEAQRISNRKTLLSSLVTNLNIVARQDSLQRIAAMPEDERNAYVKKLVRQLRRQQGLREDETPAASTAKASSPDLFSRQTKGEWYFYNPTLKTQGAAAFKQIWGNRPNVDNWRRYSDVTAQLRTNVPTNTRENPNVPADVNSLLTSERLLSTLPITAEQLAASNDSIQNALFALGNIYLNDLEDYQSTIDVYERLRENFSQFNNMSDVLFALYYSYNKLGNTAQATQMKQLLINNHPTSRYAKIISTGKDPNITKPSTEITKAYEDIYEMFIEGKFEEAEAAKRRADSIYQTNYWSPQLLYIQAVYQIRQRQDSIAKQTLQTLIQQNSNSPVAAKANNLLNVLSRRKQIEDELTALQIERPKEDTIVINPLPIARQRDTMAVQQNNIVVDRPRIRKPIADTIAKKPDVQRQQTSLYTFNPNVPHYGVLVLNKVDIVFGNEARNAFNRYNREKYYNQPLEVNSVNLDADNRLILIGSFLNIASAIEYVQKVKPIAGSEIIPWLKADKYSFTIISQNNLDVLKVNPDLTAYLKFLEQNLPLKF